MPKLMIGYNTLSMRGNDPETKRVPSDPNIKEWLTREGKKNIF